MNGRTSISPVFTAKHNDGEVIFSENQKHRIINVDETLFSLEHSVGG
jgi:hypothetical protein